MVTQVSIFLMSFLQNNFFYFIYKVIPIFFSNTSKLFIQNMKHSICVFVEFLEVKNSVNEHVSILLPEIDLTTNSDSEESNREKKFGGFKPPSIRRSKRLIEKQPSNF